MNKPEWKDAPEWARYIAQDRDGLWCWFELEPQVRINYWAVNDNGGRHFVIDNEKNLGFKDSLEARPSC